MVPANIPSTLLSLSIDQKHFKDTNVFK